MKKWAHTALKVPLIGIPALLGTVLTGLVLAFFVGSAVEYPWILLPSLAVGGMSCLLTKNYCFRRQ